MKGASSGKYLLCTFILLNISPCRGVGKILSEDEMRIALNLYDKEASELCHHTNIARWDAVTDVENKEKEAEKEKREIEYAQYRKKQWNDMWRDAEISYYKNETIRRQLFFLKQLGISTLDPIELGNFSRTVATMSNLYNTGKVCPFKNQKCNKSTEGLTLDPDISQLFAESRDFDELKYLWTEWHEISGKPMRKDYINYVESMNRIAELNGHENAAETWKSEYEDDEFEEKIDRLWSELEPLYDVLHTYMKYKLFEIYGERINRSEATIPAHLLSNVWAQSWRNLYNDTRPFKNVTLVDATPTFHELKFNARRMFEMADDFYTSLGLPTNNMSFTGQSVIEKPVDRVIQCHAQAWDFCDGKDFRIKMCTKINMEDFTVIHHEMGHIQYYLQYRDLPLPLRTGANPGFHEAIGDTIALSVATPHHLQRIGLLKNYNDTFEDNINALYSEALERVAFLPFGLLIDKWRWDVFTRRVSESEWNQHWWNLREKYQKISPPNVRNESYFDPGAKFHVPANVPYISYFVSHLLEFQFYRSLCIEAKQYDPINPSARPLHKCDFYQSKEAGKKLADTMKLGASKHWSVALRSLTNETEISAKALLEYFEPLRVHLVEEIKRMNSDAMRPILAKYNDAAAKQCNKLQLANWAKTTDINNVEKSEAYAKAVAEHAEFVREQHKKYFEGLNPKAFNDEQIQRQIKIITNTGKYALNESRLAELTKTKDAMEKIYNNAEFCDYHYPNCTEKLTLEPEMKEIMATSYHFDRLKYTWLMWHNSVGPKVRSHYKKYVEISNEAARLNNFSDYGDMWRANFEDPNFLVNVENIWKMVQPLYDALHEYTRYKLIDIYGTKMNTSDPLIPAHLLGDMWAQKWGSLYDRIKPFKNSSDIDINNALQANNYTPLKIFQEADRFYQSLGLDSNEMSYTGQSIIEKPTDRVIVCHAQAWDFCDGKDFRIKQCTSVNSYNFVTAHHEMGHIQYYILYKDQPITFRSGANPAFHEAVGDTIALAVSTPAHLKKVNMLHDYEDTYENHINALFKMALDRVAFLPFGLLIDLYRYGIFNGTTPENEWNHQWETLRERYQKIRSPVERTEEHFDAGAKFHVPADSQYISYFLAHILEFQLLRSLCGVAGQYEPNNATKALHKCDIGGSKEAGQRLRDGLSLGRSKHWSEALSKMTGGDTEFKADALLEYFKPLHEFLVAENAKMRSSGSSTWYVTAGIITAVVLIAMIAYAIYYVKKR